MSTTLLAAAQTFIARLKLSGDGPSTVIDQVQEYDEAIVALLQAHKEIVTSHIDWKFLWKQGTVQVQIGNNPNSPVQTDIRQIDDLSFYCDGSPLTFVDWPNYRRNKRSAADLAVAGTPQHVVVQPNGQVLVIPVPSALTTINFDYWAKAAELADDLDELQIPDEGLEALYNRAKMIYLADQESPNYQLAEVDFTVAYDALEDSYWPGKGKASLAQDQDIVVEPE